jgi:glutamate synthase (NADPH/NADH) small chain
LLRAGLNLRDRHAAGDMRRGQSLVVWAINEGRGTARECDRYLMGDTQLP